MNLMQLSIKKNILFFAFIVFCITAHSQEATNVDLKKANECMAGIEAKNSFTDNLNHVDMNILPVGIKKSINNMEVTLAVNSAEVYTDYTELAVFLRIKIPEKNTTLMFGAKGIRLSHEGDIVGDAKLLLMSNIEIPVSGNNVILRLKGNYDQKTEKSDDLTYATIDCQGLKGLGVAAEVELSKDLCTYVNGDGTINASKKVIGSFQTQIDNWTDLVASVSFPSFEIKGLTGFVWALQNVVVDFSDTRNDQAMKFPSEYNPYLVAGNEVLWKGVYAKDISVTLPPQFAKNKKDRVSFYAHDMLIDDNGVTGDFGATNILSFDEGNASGWSFSVDDFNMRLLANNLEEARFNGMLGLPISEKSKLRYEGQIAAGNNYYMKVSSADSISFDLFQAKAEIEPNSYVKFNVVDGKFKPEAMLHGRMGIEVASMSGNGNTESSSMGKKLTAFGGVVFRGLHIMSEAPYLTVEYLGYQGKAKLSNFPVSITQLALQTSGTKAALVASIDADLGDKIFKGSTTLRIVGEMDNGEFQHWKYTKTDLEDIQLSATIAEMIQLKGSLSILNDDPTYGDGFSGTVKVNFSAKSPLNGVGGEMRAMFGHKNFRYWFVDGIANIPGTGVMVGPALFLTGFGGGIVSKMRPQGAGKGSSANQVLTPTSMTYVPDSTYALGIKAATEFTVGKDKNIGNGEACFELAFNKKGGLNYAGFYGFAQFLATIPVVGDIQKEIGAKYRKIVDLEQEAAAKLPGGLVSTLEKTKQYDPNAAAKLYVDNDKLGEGNFTAALGIQYNFQESSFHATFDLYVNAAGGLITGAGANNRAGWAVMHFDPKDWYLHMGTPTDRIGLKMGVGNILNIQTGSYLMVGTKIPAAPGVPSQISSILQESQENLGYMKELNQIEAGKGFAFGSSMSINTGDLSFLILYAHYMAGAGFDVMIKDYGDTQCEGRSGAIGIDGWYANGQAYAYLQGELGVKINLWFMKAKVPVLTTDFAALLQAKLPNPSSFKAYIAVKAKVLGIVNVNCKFKMLIGEDCDLVIPGGSPLDMAMINDLSPTDKSSDVSVFTAPQAAFNMAIGKIFNMQDDQGEHTFRLKLKDFVLKDGNSTIEGNLKWNADGNIVSFYSHEVLPSQKDITATVSVAFEEKKGGNWTTVYTAGKEALETKTIAFKTTNAPKDIPLQNVVYSYPVVGQEYFLNGESAKGYIQLQFGQNYLFPANYNNLMKLTDKSGSVSAVPFTYDESKKRIEFSMPVTQHSSSYTVNLSLTNGEAARNETASQKVLNNTNSDSISMDSKSASAENRTDVGLDLLSYGFSTSRYSSFSEKIANIRKTIPVVNKLASDVLMFEYETADMEPFDLTDLKGTTQSENKPLIDVSATLEDSYYKNKIYPLIYQEYPIDGSIRVKNRDENIFGIPPVKDLPLMTSYLSQMEANQTNGFVTKHFPFYYNLPQAYKSDFTDLQNQVVNSNLQNTSKPSFQKFLKNGFPFISSGNYKIKMQYVMPGGEKGTTATFEYENFIK
jgi:hypothetical protein